MLSASIRTMKFKQIPDTGVLLWLLSVVVPPTFFNNTKTNFGWSVGCLATSEGC